MLSASGSEMVIASPEATADHRRERDGKRCSFHDPGPTAYPKRAPPEPRVSSVPARVLRVDPTEGEVVQSLDAVVDDRLVPDRRRDHLESRLAQVLQEATQAGHVEDGGGAALGGGHSAQSATVGDLRLLPLRSTEAGY